MDLHVEDGKYRAAHVAVKPRSLVFGMSEADLDAAEMRFAEHEHAGH